MSIADSFRVDNSDLLTMKIVLPKKLNIAGFKWTSKIERHFFSIPTLVTESNFVLQQLPDSRGKHQVGHFKSFSGSGQIAVNRCFTPVRQIRMWMLR